MAEIHLQEKQRSVWPWVVGGLILALLAWVMLSPGRGVQGPVPGTLDTAVVPADTTRPQGTAAEQFTAHVNAAPQFGDANLAHNYTRNGLRYLANALEEIARDNERAAPVRANIAALRQSAEQLGEDPTGDHARIASTVFVQASDAITRLQRAAFPTLQNESQAVADAARAMRDDVPLLEQQEQVRAFFRRASDTVQRMGAEAPTSTEPAR